MVVGRVHSATRRSLATIEGSTTRRSHATTSTIGGSSTTGRSLATTGGSTTKHHWEVACDHWGLDARPPGGRGRRLRTQAVATTGGSNDDDDDDDDERNSPFHTPTGSADFSPNSLLNGVLL